MAVELTHAEARIVMLVAAGLSRGEIQKALGIADSTLDNRWRVLSAKIGSPNTVVWLRCFGEWTPHEKPFCLDRDAREGRAATKDQTPRKGRPKVGVETPVPAGRCHSCEAQGETEEVVVGGLFRARLCGRCRLRLTEARQEAREREAGDRELREAEERIL